MRRKEESSGCRCLGESLNPWRAGGGAEKVESGGSEVGVKQSLVRGL